jgi:Tfp pilus assembly protein PilN
MMQVNVLPWRQRRRQARWRQVTHAVAGALLLAVIMLATGSWLLHKRVDALSAQQAEAFSHLQVLRQQLAQRQALVARHALLMQLAHEAQQRQAARHRHLRLLEEVEAAIPDGVWLTQWQEQPGYLRWQGLGVRYDRVMAFTRALHKGRERVAVTLESIRQQPDGLLHFVLQATWKVREQDDSSSATDHSGVAVPATPATDRRGLAAAFITHWHRLPGTAAARLAAG